MIVSSKYYDTTAAIQVIGDVLNEPSLLDDETEHSFRDVDFDNEFHKIVFGSIYNLHKMGTEKITIMTIEDYLRNRDMSFGVYKANDGSRWIESAIKNAEVSTFEYYYQRLKKMTLLRTYDSVGVDVSWVYDPDNILDAKKRQQQIEDFDSKTPSELADEIENRILRVKEVIVDDDIDESRQAGDGADETLRRLKEGEAVGYPLYDNITTNIVRGARLGTFYLRSAATGVGKTRTAMADACYLSCGMIYENNEWIETGGKIPTVFISVELDMEELQTMAWSFISGVPENHILENKYDFDEYDRVIKAIQILKDAPLWFEYLPDYDLKDVENCIKRNIRVHKTSCVFLDYLTSSMKLLEQVSRAGGGMRVREDQILLFLSAKLKDIAQQFHIFIFSSTQLSAQFKQEKYPDQTLLAGAKAIANKVDFGEILLDMTPEDCDDIAPLARQIGEMPNIKCSVYKNRRGKTNRVFLWMKADKGTCRYRTLFVTDYNLNLIEEP